jgi:hypothetical protein
VSKNPPIRPGLIIKEALETGPMGISEMHRVYKQKVYAANALRSRADAIHGATYWSFARQCQFARALGLIETVGQKDFRPYPSRKDNPLLAIRQGQVTTSTKVIYRLTAAGSSEETAWLNLRAAVKERLGWG